MMTWGEIPIPALIVVLLIFAVINIWATVRILNRAGLSPWWSLATLIPAVNLFVIWKFADVDWPNVDGRSIPRNRIHQMLS